MTKKLLPKVAPISDNDQWPADHVIRKHISALVPYAQNHAGSGYVRRRICACGRIDVVRKDNKAESGTSKRLQVHHIIPFRIARHHDQWNLVPLCVKHHKVVETMFVETEPHGLDDIAIMCWVAMIRQRQAMTATVLRQIGKRH